MYVYNDYWKSEKAMLLYPANKTSAFENSDFVNFENLPNSTDHHACALGKISIFDKNGTNLNTDIGITILKWFQMYPCSE